MSLRFGLRGSKVMCCNFSMASQIKRKAGENLSKYDNVTAFRTNNLVNCSTLEKVMANFCGVTQLLHLEVTT